MTQLRSFKGKMVESAEVFGAQETPSLGNMNTNARGDLIDEHGNIVKTHDQLNREYHTDNKKSVKRSSLLDDIDDDEINFEPPTKQAPKPKKAEPKATEQKAAESKTEQDDKGE